MIKQRYQQHDPQHMPWTNPRPRRKDYGSEYPVRGWFRRNMGYISSVLSRAISGSLGWIKTNIGYIIAGSVAVGMIFVFFGLFILAVHLLPGAIEEEISRQVAVFETATGVRK